MNSVGYSWKHHVSDEGIKALYPIEHQLAEWCLYYAIATVMGSNFRIQKNRNISFSVHHLKELSDEAKQQFPNMTAAKRLLKKLFDVGVLTESDYLGRPQYGFRYCVKNLRSYDLANVEHIRNALYELRGGGPLCAVIRISRNYDTCYNTGAVYKFDPSDVPGNPKHPPTHALSVISFALENGPFFECQDSQGRSFGKDGFLKVDVTSVKELYSFTVVEVLRGWTT